MRLWIFIFFIFSQHLSNAQEAENAQTPDPSLLPPKWWESFQDEKTVVQQRTKDLLVNIEKIPDDLSESNREEARNLVDDIKVNFQAWSNIYGRPAPLSKPATTLKDSYTINQFRELYNRQQKLQVDLESKKKEMSGLKQQLEANQNRLDNAIQEYQAALDRSQKKMINGLKILKFRSAVETGKIKIQLLGKTIAVEEQQIRNIDDEIQRAKKRLDISENNLKEYAGQVQILRRAWDDTKQEKQRQEILFAEDYSKNTDEAAETNNNLLTINLADALLKEMLAHINYLRLDLIYNLALLIEEPDSIDIEQLDLSIKDWKAQTKSFQLRLDDLKTQAERILQRASQVLTLEEISSPRNVTRLDEVVNKTQNTLLEIQKVRGELNETNFLLKVVDETSISFRGQGERWIRIVFDFVSKLVQAASDKLSQTLFYIGTHPVSVMTIIEFIIIMVLTWWFSRLVTGTISTFSRKRKGIRKALIYRLNRLIHYFILFIGGLIGLSWIGFDFSNLVLIAGALGVGLGFGLQNIFNNFLSGIIILFQSHLKVGDYIEIDTGLRGEIREINVRSTVVTTNDGIEVIIPNSEMVSNRVVNWTLRDPYRRVHVPFSVAYGSDIDKITKIVVEAAKKVPSTLQRIGVREPQIFLLSLGDNGIEMELIVWVDEKWTRRNRNTRSQYLFAIEKALRENGIEIPFPQRDIHVRTESKEKKLLFPDKFGKKKEVE